MKAPDELLERRIELPGGSLRILQPADSAELPDDGGVEWAPVVPYWSVLWRSGVALAEEAGCSELSGRRVIELGCGLGLPSIAAARAGAIVTAVDVEPDALVLLERNAAANGIELATACVDWADPAALLEDGRVDLVLAADVLYEPGAAAALATTLPSLAPEAWVADPSRPGSPSISESFRLARPPATTVRGVVSIHRLTLVPA